MPADPTVIRAYLEDAEADLAMVEAGLKIANRHATYHLHQAAEKLVKAVRIHSGLQATKEHRIEILVEGALTGEPKRLPDGGVWRPLLLPLEPLSDYATAFRYPTPTGKLKPASTRPRRESGLRLSKPSSSEHEETCLANSASPVDVLFEWNPTVSCR